MPEENPPPAAPPNLTPARQVAPPEGFRPMELWDPFEAWLGPFFERDLAAAERERGQRMVAFYVDDRHLNGNGVAHGGMLMTFADAVLGGCAWDANDRRTCVTLSMQSNFLKPARQGDLVVCRAEVARRTRSITFVRGKFEVRGEEIFTASSLWKVIDM